MVNLVQPMLHNFPLKYGGTCLIGVTYVYHHANPFSFNPFTGIASVSGVSNCSVNKVLRAIITEDKVNGDLSGQWDNLYIIQKYNSRLELDCKTKNYKGLDAVKITDPDVLNTKYWKLGIKFYIRDAIKNFPTTPWVLPDGTIIESSAAGSNNNRHIVYSALVSDIIDLKEVINSQTNIKDNPSFVKINNDGDISIALEGTRRSDPMFCTFVINFDINTYQNDHIELYNKYYLLYNLSIVNNISFTPKHKEVQYA